MDSRVMVACPSREQLIHHLQEAAELEHCLMCTYLYAGFSLRSGTEEGLTAHEADVVQCWGRMLRNLAIEEMGHLTAVWNLTAALGGAPRFGRQNLPLEPGFLPAGLVVRLSPFNEASVQHFIHLERPADSPEADGQGFTPRALFPRAVSAPRLTPLGVEYETVGAFYRVLESGLEEFVREHGELAAFCGDAALQLSRAETGLAGATPVLCLQTARRALETIVEQGEGARSDSAGSHFQRFVALRKELAALKALNPAFLPAWPAAENPVLRPPPRSAGHVWIENEAAAAVVDLANAAYALTLRLLAQSYSLPSLSPEKALSVELAVGLMRAVTPLAERAARLPAGPAHPGCNAGMSFTAPRDAAALPSGAGTWRFLTERLRELSSAAATLATDGDARTVVAARVLGDLLQRSGRALAPRPSAAAQRPLPPAPPATAALTAAASSSMVDGVERVEGKHLAILYEGKRCIHARHCVTWGPEVFLANVPGAWIHPDALPLQAVLEIAHVCPSGAIRYQRKDGCADEAAPPVNLLAVREAGPYAIRADLRLSVGTGIEAGRFRATLCRCGASQNKPFCDGSHRESGFQASGEPPSERAEMLPVRDGPLEIEPLENGPLEVRGNLEITTGTGRVVSRLVRARLCRCGGSGSKPFCDGTHARIGFRST